MNISRGVLRSARGRARFEIWVVSAGSGEDVVTTSTPDVVADITLEARVVSVRAADEAIGSVVAAQFVAPIATEQVAAATQALEAVVVPRALRTDGRVVPAAGAVYRVVERAADYHLKLENRG